MGCDHHFIIIDWRVQLNRPAEKQGTFSTFSMLILVVNNITHLSHLPLEVFKFHIFSLSDHWFIQKHKFSKKIWQLIDSSSTETMFQFSFFNCSAPFHTTWSASQMTADGWWRQVTLIWCMTDTIIVAQHAAHCYVTICISSTQAAVQMVWSQCVTISCWLDADTLFVSRDTVHWLDVQLTPQGIWAGEGVAGRPLCR